MNYSIELLRLASILLIIFSHTRHNIDQGIYYVIFAVIPTYGTAILSIISGFLFSEYSSKKNNLLNKKIKTLLIPFIISNVLIIIIVCLLKVFGYEYINRLSFDLSLITEGLLSLNSEPINPPTYFIRDIFLLFCILAFFKKNYYSLIFILPYLLFGTLFLRMDVILLFVCGWIISTLKIYIYEKQKILINILFLVCFFLIFTKELYILKFFSAILIFILLFNVKIKFYNVGGFSYLLHLYHVPIIVLIHPILLKYFSNDVIIVLLQFFITVFTLYVTHRLLKYYRIGIITGHRL